MCRETADTGKKTVQSPHEPEARYAEKRKTQWVGYRAQVTETANPGEVNFLTDVETDDANDSDSECIDGIHQRLADRELSPTNHYVDQGYVTGRNIAHSTKRGVDLQGPIVQDSSSKPAGFKQADFELQVATCPDGQTSVSWLPRPQPDGPVLARSCSSVTHVRGAPIVLSVRQARADAVSRSVPTTKRSRPDDRRHRPRPSGKI